MNRLKHFLIAALIFGGQAWASDSILRPEAQNRLRKNLQILAQNTERAKKNLAAAIHNTDVLTAELTELDRLQREHEALKAKYEGIDKKGADKEKSESLLRGIEQGLGEINAHRIPLQKQLKSWKERQTIYEAKVAEFEKKREELDAPPSSHNETED